MNDPQPQPPEASLAQLKLTPEMEERFRALLNRGEYQIPAFMLQVTLDEIVALRAERDEARSALYFSEAGEQQAEARVRSLEAALRGIVEIREALSVVPAPASLMARIADAALDG